mmetsp:Transcript_20398/g.58531  ORF Transcript_20398/g.58531 Transcript_20398/m.58531 type:complete len:107 (+) Transcript_20398:1926-2246(+)
MAMNVFVLVECGWSLYLTFAAGAGECSLWPQRLHCVYWIVRLMNACLVDVVDIDVDVDDEDDDDSFAFCCFCAVVGKPDAGFGVAVADFSSSVVSCGPLLLLFQES